MSDNTAEFNNTQRVKSAEEKLWERSVQRAAALQVKHIEKLNAERPTAQLLITLKPDGPSVEEVISTSAAKQNLAVDENVQAYKRSIMANRGKARDHFERAVERER